MTVPSWTIVRLQVQIEPLKVGRAPLRQYTPSLIESVPRLQIGPDGVVGIGRFGQRLVDAHHVEHPHSRDRRGQAGISVMATGDYLRLRERYGPHLTEGVAGESILVDCPEGLAGRSLPERLTLLTAAGELGLDQVQVAEPCAEFTRFCLGLAPSPEVGDDVREHLELLDHGARGYKAVATGAATLELGDRLSWG